MAAASVDLIGWAPGDPWRGIGRSLYADATARRRAAGRTTACGELHVVDDEGPLAFARALGAESVHEEDHLVLDLPMDGEHLRRLQARDASDYEIVRWQGRCPDDLIDAYAAMAVARRADGVLGGYSLVYLPLGRDHVLQDDTLVMPDHRGHRLGLALKLATYAAIATEHPERTRFHTWTAAENRAMRATNTAFGYRPVERMHEVQVKD